MGGWAPLPEHVDLPRYEEIQQEWNQRDCPDGAQSLNFFFRCCPCWSCYQIDVLGSMPMRLAALLSLVLLSPGVVYAHDSHKVRASDKSQEVATARAMRRLPEGATVTDTSCKKLNYVFQTRWRCTITYSD